MKRDRTQTDFEELLQEQIEFLKASSKSFDERFVSEAKRMAVTARVLLHDTTNSTSLLTHLGKKDIQFLDTSFPLNPMHIGSYSALVMFHTVRFFGSRLVPILDQQENSRWLSFDDWWNGVVIVDTLKNQYSRRDIVLTLANKDGGAHIDHKIDELYDKASTVGSLGWVFENSDEPGKTFPTESFVPPTMRQITYEVLKSLAPDYECSHPRNSRGQIEGAFIGGFTFTEGSGPHPMPAANVVKKTN